MSFEIDNQALLYDAQKLPSAKDFKGYHVFFDKIWLSRVRWIITPTLWGCKEKALYSWELCDANYNPLGVHVVK